jgi:hypothetical protein
LLAESFLKVGALRDLTLGPGEVLSQLAILAPEIGGMRCQFGDTATIPGLLCTQSAQTSLGSAHSQARLFQLSMGALQLVLEGGPGLSGSRFGGIAASTEQKHHEGADDHA